VNKYEVKLMYIYSDTLEVWALSEKDAIETAQKDGNIEETYESYYDADAIKLN
jgi:hypothetical protein